MALVIERIDHFVLTVESVEKTVAFYRRLFDLRVEEKPDRPTALNFGGQKINLHQADRTFEPKAARPTPGGGDFCVIVDKPIDEIVATLQAAGVAIELGPVLRLSATGKMNSVYFRDPDDNLVEIGTHKGPIAEASAGG